MEPILINTESITCHELLQDILKVQTGLAKIIGVKVIDTASS